MVFPSTVTLDAAGKLGDRRGKWLEPERKTVRRITHGRNVRIGNTDKAEWYAPGSLDELARRDVTERKASARSSGTIVRHAYVPGYTIYRGI
jgi:hypothetical protein